MTGEVGLGQRVLSGARSPQEQALAGSLDALGLQVNRDNVLQVRNALKAESVRLGRLMRMHGPMLHLGECGPDPVSAPAAGLFNRKVEALAGQCNSYVESLREAANLLEGTARSYGYNEEQIQASFDAFRPNQLDSPTEGPR
jgi:hypothetical protein